MSISLRDPGSRKGKKASELTYKWGLRFKIGVCHTKNTFLKHVALLNRFEIVVLVHRDFGLR